MIVETEILLCDLHLRHYLRVRHGAEDWMKGFARLEIDWSILHLQQDVWSKLAVEWMQVLVCRPSAVVAGLHVVNKSAPHHDAVMRCDCRCKHVRAVSMCAVVSSWTRLAFAVC